MKYLVFNYLNIDLDNIFLILSKSFDKRKYVINQDFFNTDFLKNSTSNDMGFPKAIFFSPKNCQDKTIMISNYKDGWVTLGNFISNEYGAFNYNFRLSQDDSLINSFNYWEKGKELRVVYTMKDTKWVFYEQGNPLWFEDTNNYKKRFIKDRLNFNILTLYCKKIGIDILNNDFFKSDKEAVYIKQMNW